MHEGWAEGFDADNVIIESAGYPPDEPFSRRVPDTIPRASSSSAAYPDMGFHGQTLKTEGEACSTTAGDLNTNERFATTAVGPSTDDSYQVSDTSSYFAEDDYSDGDYFLVEDPSSQPPVTDEEADEVNEDDDDGYISGERLFLSEGEEESSPMSSVMPSHTNFADDSDSDSGSTSVKSRDFSGTTDLCPGEDDEGSDFRTG